RRPPATAPSALPPPSGRLPAGKPTHLSQETRAGSACQSIADPRTWPRTPERDRPANQCRPPDRCPGVRLAAALVAGRSLSSTEPSHGGVRRGLPKGPEERPHVADQEIGHLHRGEVAAAVKLRPVDDVVTALAVPADGVVLGEHRHPGRRRTGWL